MRNICHNAMILLGKNSHRFEYGVSRFSECFRDGITCFHLPPQRLLKFLFQDFSFDKGQRILYTDQTAKAVSILEQIIILLQHTLKQPIPTGELQPLFSLRPDRYPCAGDVWHRHACIGWKFCLPCLQCDHKCCERSTPGVKFEPVDIFFQDTPDCRLGLLAKFSPHGK